MKMAGLSAYLVSLKIRSRHKNSSPSIHSSPAALSRALTNTILRSQEASPLIGRIHLNEKLTAHSDRRLSSLRNQFSHFENQPPQTWAGVTKQILDCYASKR